MQINKKMFTVAITALLLLSMFAFASPALAAPAVTLYDNNGAPLTGNQTVGQTINVTTTERSAGALINIYFENLGGQLLASGYADGLGRFTAKIVIPETVAGTHYLIVQDTTIYGTIPATITIAPKITTSITTGIPGDTVTVTGTGFAPTSNMTVTFSNSTGTLYFKNLVTAKFNSSSLGSFTFVFTVPTVNYGTYNINATDALGNLGTASFIVGPAITITPASGPTGTLVSITGRGFIGAAGTEVIITIGALNVINTTTIRTAADGTFSGQFVVPIIALGSQTVTATAGVHSATKSFKVTGVSSITTSPTSGAPGNTISITGTNFTASSTVTVTMSGFTIGTYTTNSTGGFTGTFTVPSLPTTGYSITGTDANGLTAVASFQIAITNLALIPSFGPTGTSVTAIGFGFTGTNANITLGIYQVATNVPVSTLITTGAQFSVPTMPTGIYTVTVNDNIGLMASATFNVTATSTLTVAPSTAPAGIGNIALILKNFPAATNVNFYIINSTKSYALSVDPKAPFTSLTTDALGRLNGTFTVPALDLGTYTIVANETSGKWNATTTFTIGAPTLSVITRASSYAQGSVLSFDIRSTFTYSFDIYLYDPAGTISIVSIYAGNFIQNSDVYVYPYSWGSMWGYNEGSAFYITSDATIGTWTWNATIVPGTVKSGSFVVTAAAATSNVTLNDLSNKIDLLNKTVSTIAGDTSSIKTSITTLQGTVTSIQNSIATISAPNLGSITAALSTLESKLNSVSGDTASIKTTLGDVITKLDNIGTTVTSIQGTTATISTSIGTLTGTITEINNGVATIQTNIGTLQADVSGIATDMTAVSADASSAASASNNLSPLIIVAIVLALVAAIAAIASIVLMRRKIAG